MIIIGEKLNSTLKAVRPAMADKDEATITNLAKSQYEAGAAYIDLNAAMMGENEIETLQWLTQLMHKILPDVPLAFDSPDENAIKKALEANKNPNPMVNSITAEKERFDAMAPVLKEFKPAIVALCMDDTGMPETADDRFKIADKLINDLVKLGLKHSDIYIDPMIRPIGTGSHYGTVAIETIRGVKQKFPEVHVTAGLSNISFGLPGRKVINQVFMISCMNAGMDSAILDPLDKKLMTLLYACEAVLGVDDYCVNWLTKYREGALEV